MTGSSARPGAQAHRAQAPGRAAIIGIGTAVPTTRLDQSAVRDLFAAQSGVDRLTKRLIAAAFDQSAIETRHTALPELGAHGAGTDEAGTGEASRSEFIDGDGRILSPPTGVRNDVYVRAAPGLYAAAARDALAQAGVDASEVTHVVTASCTGFFAPGPDFRLVRDLGLRTTVSREHLGFLGCAAALPALRSAARICAADPGAVVLVACAEICTIHLRASNDPDQIVSSAVFADGAAAAIVTAARADDRPRIDLDRFTTAITDDGEQAMGWTIGDHGFEMTLTAEVPRIVGREVRAALAPVLGGARERATGDPGTDDEGADDEGARDADGADPTGGEPRLWAVHPGGRSILDRVEEALALPPDALRHSRDVLRENGNMSSATILFILQRMLADAGLDDDSDRPGGTPLVAVAFAPGLTVEAARMTVHTGIRPARNAARDLAEGAARGDAAGRDAESWPVRRRDTAPVLSAPR